MGFTATTPTDATHTDASRHVVAIERSPKGRAIELAGFAVIPDRRVRCVVAEISYSRFKG
jgi:hypothetical protein